MGEIPATLFIIGDGMKLTPRGPIFNEGLFKITDGHYVCRKYITTPENQHYWINAVYKKSDDRKMFTNLSIFDAQEKSDVQDIRQKPLLHIDLGNPSSFGLDEQTIGSSLEEICLGCEGLIDQGKTLSEIRDYYNPPVT